MLTTVTITYLQSFAPEALRRAPRPAGDIALRQARLPSPTLGRYLYTAVGGDWYWRDRLGWTYARWMQHLDRPEVETWVLYVSDTPAGYIELERQQQGRDVEIAYFGLLPEFIGRGLGGWLLSEGIARAWELASHRVWVHTCTLDGPQALANYRARGLSVYQTEDKRVEDLGAPDGPWPGAGAR